MVKESKPIGLTVSKPFSADQVMVKEVFNYSGATEQTNNSFKQFTPYNIS